VGIDGGWGEPGGGREPGDTLRGAAGSRSRFGCWEGQAMLSASGECRASDAGVDPYKPVLQRKFRPRLGHGLALSYTAAPAPIERDREISFVNSRSHKTLLPTALHSNQSSRLKAVVEKASCKNGT